MKYSICLRCKHKRYCETGVTQPSENSYVTGCSRFEPKPQQTNADKIRAMTDEELAEWCAQEAECPPTRLLCQEYACDAGQCWLEWLQEEADE